MKLIFVYNANSGKLNSILDIAHKVVSPSTYQCSLCSLTHGALTEKAQWKAFKNNAKHTLTFYHKDEFEKKYHTTFDYPVILQTNEDKQTMDIIFKAEQLNSFNSVEQLIAAINAYN